MDPLRWNRILKLLQRNDSERHRGVGHSVFTEGARFGENGALMMNERTSGLVSNL